MTNITMTPKQQRFVEEYLVDLNATQAAIRAGYSEKTARSQGQRLLTNVDIAMAIEAGQTERSERTEVTQDYVLEVIRETIEAHRGSGENSNPAAVLKGAELLGRHLAMFTDKLESKHSTARLTDEELDERIADFERRAASAPRITHGAGR